MKTFVLRLNKLIEHSIEMMNVGKDYNSWKGKFDAYNVVKLYLSREDRTKKELVSLLNSLKMESVNRVMSEIDTTKLEHENGRIHAYNYMLDFAAELR